MLKHALIATWSGFQDQEVIYPYYRLQEDGFAVVIVAEEVKTIVGINGTKMYAADSYEGLRSLVSCRGTPAVLNIYDLLVLPGGVKALEKLRQEPFILDLLGQWYRAGRVISSICHGAQLLISAGLVRGHRISGYYSIKDDINNAGGTYVDAPVVVDGTIVSSPHYKHMGEWMKETLRVYYEVQKRGSS